MIKFQCHYKLQASWVDEKGQPQLYTVQDPITIQFSVQKVQFQSDNSARIVVTNMDGAVREALYQDRLIFGSNRQIKKLIVLDAGYGDMLATVCKGWISECYSIRQGTDVLTIIEVIDPDILSEYCSITFQSGTSFKEAYQYLTSQMPNLQVGECGELLGEFKIPVTFNGNTFVAINKLTGQHTFIENGVIHTLQDNETLSDYGCYLISSETGLLGTPRRREAILEVSMLFEPTLRIGQLVEIKADKNDSTTFKFNGQYKILELYHECTISGSEEGQRITNLHLQYLEFTTNSNVNLTSNPEGSPPSVVKNNKIQPITVKIGSAVQSIYKYIMNKNGSVPNNPITNLITWKDMIYPIKTGNTPADVKSSISLDKLARCETIATLLSECCNKYFKGKRIVITSGYRTPQNNAKNEASSNNSNHKIGAAIDFYIPGVPIQQLRDTFSNKSIWGYGVGIYLKNNFIHVSTNPGERFTVRKKV